MDKIGEASATQNWTGIEIVSDLPGRGRGVKASKSFKVGEVVCNYNGNLLTHKEGKIKYRASDENSMGYMFEFTFKGTKLWRDATTEAPGPGRLINHSKCHNNVSTNRCFRSFTIC